MYILFNSSSDNPRRSICLASYLFLNSVSDNSFTPPPYFDIKLESDGIEDPPDDSEFLLLLSESLLLLSESLLSVSDFTNSFSISIESNSESEIILFNIFVNKVDLPFFILIFLHFLHNLHLTRLPLSFLQSLQPSLHISFLIFIALFLLIILSIGLPGISPGGPLDLLLPPPSDDVSDKYFNSYSGGGWFLLYVFPNWIFIGGPFST